MIITRDGSHTISIPERNVTYHSTYGAIQESKHVFIEAGLHYLIDQFQPTTLKVFEMGLGTGLNAFLTAIEAENGSVKIHYTAVEQFPLTTDEVKVLNYTEQLQQRDLFQKIHNGEWEENVIISEHFILRKKKIGLLNFSSAETFNLIYYDAFAPRAQPELWTKEVFEKLFRLLQPNGILVTYCSKGDVRRAMMAAGFNVKKLPGPPGKREMLMAMKLG